MPGVKYKTTLKIKCNKPNVLSEKHLAFEIIIIVNCEITNDK